MPTVSLPAASACPSCGGAGVVHPRRPNGAPDYGRTIPCPSCRPSRPVSATPPDTEAIVRIAPRRTFDGIDEIDFACSPAWVSHYAREPRIERCTDYPDDYYEDAPGPTELEREAKILAFRRRVDGNQAEISYLRNQLNEHLARAQKPKAPTEKPRGLVQL